jgi:hypothetical protein
MGSHGTWSATCNSCSGVAPGGIMKGASNNGFSAATNNYSFTTNPINGNLAIVYSAHPYSFRKNYVEEYNGTSWIEIGTEIGNMYFLDITWNNAGDALYVGGHKSVIYGTSLNYPGYEIKRYAGCSGCTDPAASNYDPTATNDDGSCIVASACDCNNNCSCAGTTVISDSEFEQVLEDALTSASGVVGTIGDNAIDNTYKCLIKTIHHQTIYSTGNYYGIQSLNNIKEITCLEELSVAGNDITGTVDLTNMLKLQNIDLSFNKVTLVNLTGCAELLTFVCEGGLTTSLGNNPNSCLPIASQCSDPFAGCNCTGNCRDHRTLTAFTPTDSPLLNTVLIINQPLTSLDLSENSKLTYLEVGILEGITSLDLSHMSILETIRINAKGISSFTLTLSSTLDLTQVIWPAFVVRIHNGSALQLF